MAGRMTNAERDTYLEDVYTLRKYRKMTVPQIAEALEKDKRQIDRWVKMLKAERRWPTFVRPAVIRSAPPKDKETGRWVKNAATS